MKKILEIVSILLISINLNAINFEEEKYSPDFISYLKMSCDIGINDSCVSLGSMYNNGDGVKRDSFKAVKLYKKACDSGFANGCSHLGLMYYYGRGVKQDSSKAIKLFKKACEARDFDGCENYKILNSLLLKHKAIKSI